jgi:hypothetical protein
MSVNVPETKFFDRELVLKKGNVLGDGYSSIIDMGSAYGWRSIMVKGVIQVTGVSGTNPTLDVAIKAGNSTPPTDDLYIMPQISGAGEYIFAVPENAGRYIRLFFDVSGTSPVFTINAFLSPYTD